MVFVACFLSAPYSSSGIALVHSVLRLASWRYTKDLSNCEKAVGSALVLYFAVQPSGVFNRHLLPKRGFAWQPYSFSLKKWIRTWWICSSSNSLNEIHLYETSHTTHPATPTSFQIHHQYFSQRFSCKHFSGLDFIRFFDSHILSGENNNSDYYRLILAQAHQKIM